MPALRSPSEVIFEEDFYGDYDEDGRIIGVEDEWRDEDYEEYAASMDSWNDRGYDW